MGALGHTSDDETGLIYMRARYYDPNTGRFASEDPARHGINWFIYANNPVKYVDRNGKEVEEPLFSSGTEAGIGAEGAGVPEELLYSTKHGTQELANWFSKWAGREMVTGDIEEVLSLWNSRIAQMSSSGNWLVKTRLYNAALYLIASQEAREGEWEGIGRLVTAYSPFD